MLFSEFQGNQCSLTFLEDYKKNPKTAQPYMTMRIYEDLLVSKGLALMRGDVGGMMTKKVCTSKNNVYRVRANEMNERETERNSEIEREEERETA